MLVDAAWQPAPSPNGRSVAFQRFTDRGSSLIALSSADATQHVLVDAGQFPEVFSPRYSPDGTRIAFGARSYGRRVAALSTSLPGGRLGMARTNALTCVALLVVLCCACGPGASPPTPLLTRETAPVAPTVAAPPSTPAAAQTSATATAVDPVSGDIVVFAASSLTDAFKEIAAEFQKVHPSARVVLIFGGSSQLPIQLINGARADVFASADQDQMDLVDRGKVLTSPQQVFIRNRLMVIAPRAIRPASPLSRTWRGLV